MIDYAELHCHSSFSLLDGASNPEELVIAAKELGLSALAITDHNDLGGIVRFAEAARELDFPAIIGGELTLADDSHIILLAENIAGYKNLCYLINQARSNCQRGSPKISYESLAEYADGLIALSGCPHGATPYHIARGNIQEAKRLIKLCKDIFQQRFFIELWDHGLSQEAILAKELYELAKHYALPCVVTNNVHYAYQTKSIIHDVLTCLKHNVTLSTAGRRLRPNDNWYLKSPEAMYALWHNYPQFLHNTIDIAQRCGFRLTALKPSLPHFATPDNLSHDDYLEKLVWQGAKQLFTVLTDKHKEQIKHELAVIKHMQFAPYFLIMHDIVMFARNNDILVQGRGSAANSVICYCLSITAVDPVAMELLFERFICEGANEPPDIDLDIAHQHREIVLQYVYNKYGRAHAAMVCEAITYRGRSAVRDAARVLDFTQEQIDQLASKVYREEAKEAAEILKTEYSEMAGAGEAAGMERGYARLGKRSEDQAAQTKDKRVQLLTKVVAGLNGLPRHRSIHVGGFVLTGEPLGKLVPIEPASMPERTIIQWDKDDLVPMGMFKLDLLGLGMLSMLQEAMRLIKLHRGIDFDLAKLNMHDQEVFKMLQEADTVGIFQIESRAQMSILPKLRPTCFYDIVVSIALIRPGPIQGNIVHPYLRRRRGLEPITYTHPSLKPILERTLGVPLFQEQGMRVAVIAANFTTSEADQLRRVMSFKRAQEKMPQICLKLAAGMRKNGFSEEAINSLTGQLQGFANYGFPESHSASFALLAYASAYLKRHYAAEFYCASLNAQPLGFYSPNTLIQDALRHNVKILPIDIAKSNWDCTLEKNNTENKDKTQHIYNVRLGLRYIQGLGSKTKKLLEQSWAQSGAFTSTEDVCERSQLNPETINTLAKAGAFETFIPERRQALWEIIALNKKQLKQKESAKLPLANIQLTLADLNIPVMTELEKTIADYQTQQLSTHAHIMQFYRPWAKSKGMRACAELHKGKHDEFLTIAACIICRQRPATAKGFMFFTLEDETGMANVIIKPKILQAYKKVLLEETFVAISGQLQIDEGVINVIVNHAQPLPTLKQPGAKSSLLPSRNFH